MADGARELGVVEDTLYVPMLGRIYASECFRNILYDEKALELKDRLPAGIVENSTQTQYTYLASASRSANMDRYIADFLRSRHDGVIVQLGVGLETTFYRCDNGCAQWYGVDLPHVMRRAFEAGPPGQGHMPHPHGLRLHHRRELRHACHGQLRPAHATSI